MAGSHWAMQRSTWAALVMSTSARSKAVTAYPRLVNSAFNSTPSCPPLPNIATRSVCTLSLWTSAVKRGWEQCEAGDGATCLGLGVGQQAGLRYADGDLSLIHI